MDTDFEFDMRLDDNGVLLFKFGGVFDVDQWVDRQRAATARLFGNGIDPGLPAVVDLRRFIPPQGDWNKIAKLVFARSQTMGETRQRCALITGGNVCIELACRFYITSKAVMSRTECETRTFCTFEDGYAWAAENLVTPVPTRLH